MSRRDELEKVEMSLRMRLRTFEACEWECEDRCAGCVGEVTPARLPLDSHSHLTPTPTLLPLPLCSDLRSHSDSILLSPTHPSDSYSLLIATRPSHSLVEHRSFDGRSNKIWARSGTVPPRAHSSRPERSRLQTPCQTTP